MRKNTKKVDIIIIAVIVLLIIGGILLALLPEPQQATIGSIVSADTDGDGKITYKDYIGRKVGIMTGSSFEEQTFNFLPDSEYYYYDTTSDLILALNQKKIDCFIEDEPVLRIAHAEQPELSYLPEVLKEDKYSFCFQKTGEKSELLRKQFNEMIADLTADGTMDKLREKWYDNYDPENAAIDRSGITGENGTLNVFVNPLNVPSATLVNGELKGHAVELMTMFCQRYGYDCIYDQANIAAGLAGISSGIYDIGANNITITPEREESVNFSDPVYYGGIALAVRSEDLGSIDLSLDSFNGKRAGVLTGSVQDLLITQHFPDSPQSSYNSLSDLVTALYTNKIDYFVGGMDNVEMLRKEKPDLRYLDVPIETMYSGALFPKTADGDKLLAEFNKFLNGIKADGTLDEIYRYWKGDESEGKYVDMSGLTPKNGTLRFANDTIDPPMSYISNGKAAGVEPDIMVRFCREYGYGLDLTHTDIAGLIPGLTSGLYDIAMADLTITEERKQSVNFSVPYSSGKILLITRTPDAGTGENGIAEWFESIGQSFEKNFIREDRWQLILEGIGTTCLITVLSAIAGSILAFLICMFRRTGSKLANVISNIYVKLLQGTPIVVLLMILYYVVLGKSGMDAVWVAVIGFSLNFGAYASEIMRSGIESIDGGQLEAALALGYTENQAFFRFIFPQAVVRFIPVYKQEIVSLLKSTSIVGYIAIQDLTKMSDIIRSRTYEAFFPLIATAIIYFLLAWIISLILNLIFKLTGPKRR